MKFSASRWYFAAVIALGCSAKAAASDGKVTVGVVGPLTAPSKAFGIGHLQGITLAVDQYNRDLPDGAPEVVLQICDDQADGSKSAEAVRHLVQEGAVAVLGPCNSRCAAQIITDVLPQTPIPVISALATRTDLISIDRSHFFFRGNMPDKSRIEKILNDLSASGRFQGLVALYDSPDAYGDGLEADVEGWLRANRSKPLHDRFLKLPFHESLSSEDAKSRIQEALEHGFTKSTDAYLILGLDDDGVTFAKAAQECGLVSPLFMPEPNQLRFQKAASDQIDVTKVHTFNVWNPDNGEHNDFIDSFPGYFHEETTYASALAYDATKILLGALAYTWSHRPSGPVNIAQIRAELKNNLESEAGLSTESSEFAISTGHHFDHKREYSALTLLELRYDSHGQLRPWSYVEPATLSGPASATYHNLTDFFRWRMFAFLWLLGIAGSMVRELYQPGSDPLALLRKPIFWIKSSLLDPLISVLSFLTIYLAIWATNPGFISRNSTSGFSILDVSAIVVGFFAGFLGIRSIYAVLKKVGIESA